MAIFDYTHPKIIETTFSFPESVPACKKSVFLICLFLRRLILELCDKTSHIHSWRGPPKQILVNF